MADSLAAECNQKLLQSNLASSLKIIEIYSWLINSYVLDFYVMDHWSKLPRTWKRHLESLNPEELTITLRGDSKSTSVRPLSLLCLISLLQRLCISRVPKNNTPFAKNRPETLVDHPKLRNFFNKGVKQKKRHEVEKMAHQCYIDALNHSVDFVVDLGAGLGHLARTLGYAYGIQVCCLEMQSVLNEQAERIDLQFEQAALKYLTAPEIQHFRKPVHATWKLTKEFSAEQFIRKIVEWMGLAEHAHFSFGIVGLHPCGDLGAILIKMFLTCPQAKFINLVGCCYMKLSTSQGSIDPGYPLSEFLKKTKKFSSALNYEAREIACHASEIYWDRLDCGRYDHLRIHSFRAAIERIIIKHCPDLRHTGLRNVKHTTDMSFEKYAALATKDLNIPISEEDVTSETTLRDLQQWKQIVIFYTMRLFFAPLIESVILQDRLLCLLEKNCSVHIRPVFDPRISPRNHITSASKRHY